MAISVYCPFCRVRLKVPDKLRGATATCPKCKGQFLVPVVQSDASEAQTDTSGQQAATPVPPPPLPLPAPEHPSVPERTVVYQPVLVRQPQNQFDFSELSAPPREVTVNYTQRNLGSFSTAFGSSFGGCLGLAAACLLVFGGCVSVMFVAGLFVSRDKDEPQENAVKPVSQAPKNQPTTPSAKSKPLDEWVDARSSLLQHGDVRVRFLAVYSGKVPLKDLFEDSRSASELLAIHLELSNTHPTKKLTYQTWRGKDLSFTRDYATLRDNFGNSYKRISFGLGVYPLGAVEGTVSLYPQQSVTDILVFERPVPNAQQFFLELPAQNFGGNGFLRFKFSSDLIQAQP